MMAKVNEELFATHSGKRTLLHWAAVAGLSVDVRRLLGHHVVKTDASWLTYSADAMSAPVRELINVIKQVAKGELAVKYALTVDSQPELNKPFAEYKATAGEVRCDSESSSSESSDASSGEETKELLSLTESGGVDMTEYRHEGEQFELYRHVKYGTFHWRARGALEVKFLCGRRPSEMYVAVENDPSNIDPACATCLWCGQGVLSSR